MAFLLKICALLFVAVAYVHANEHEAAEASEESNGKCWSEDCDNKLRDCGRYVVHCVDTCHHACVQNEKRCEHYEVKLHGHGKTPFSARRKCHDINYNCIFGCFDVCGMESELVPCVKAADRHCKDTCAHEHDHHDGDEVPEGAEHGEGHEAGAEHHENANHEAPDGAEHHENANHEGAEHREMNGPGEHHESEDEGDE